MQAESAKWAPESLPKVEAEVLNLTITYARARMWIRKVGIRGLVKKLKIRGLTEDRLTKVLRLTKGYPATEEETSALAKELGLSQEKLWKDATVAIDAALDAPLADASKHMERFEPIPIYGKHFLRAVPQLADRNVTIEHGIVDVPVIGRIAAGRPIEIFEQVDRAVKVSSRHLVGKSDHFALTVSGQSMTAAGIEDGDDVVICRDPDPPLGRIVVALVSGEGTLKRYQKDGDGKFWLVAETDVDPNPYPDVEVTDQVRFRGYVVVVNKADRKTLQTPRSDKTSKRKK